LPLPVSDKHAINLNSYFERSLTMMFYISFTLPEAIAFDFEKCALLKKCSLLLSSSRRSPVIYHL